MARFNRDPENKSLQLLPVVFEKLHEELMKIFTEENSIDVRLLLDYQLYGFDQYDESKPNFKNYIHSKTGVHVNGKYLYNKMRDWNNGVKKIKLTREYIHVYFNCLGYKNVVEFINKIEFDPIDSQEQLREVGLYEEGDLDDEYYIGYYYGEDHEIIKTKLTIYNRYKNVDWTLVYWENDINPARYTYKGIVTEVRGTITFYFSKDNAATERNVLISVFFGNKNIINKPFLMGTYSGFDRNNCPVGGKIIFERVPTQDDQEKQVLSREIDLTIRSEITNERIIVNSILPQNRFELSEESITANRLKKYYGFYVGFIMDSGDQLSKCYLTIENNSNRASLKFFDSRTHTGFFKIVSMGEILYGVFDISQSYSRLVLVLNSSFYKENYLLGTYSGISQSNRPVGGRICFTKSKLSAEDQLLESDSKTIEKISDDTDVRLEFVYNFFLGKEDQFAPSYSALKKIEDKLEFVSQKVDDKMISSLVGDFQIYYLDEDEKFLNIEALKIKEDGTISHKSSVTTYSGFARIFGDGLLSININSDTNHEYYAQLLVFVGKYQYSEIQQLHGIFNTLGKDYAPIAHKVLLLKPTEKESVTERLNITESSVASLSKNPFLKDLFEAENNFIKSERSVH